MRRLLRGCLPLTVAVLGLLLSPASGSASVEHFGLGGSHGYRISVLAVGFSTSIQATRAKGSNPKRGAWVDYIAHVKQGGTNIEASFGELGRVEMRFRPSGRVSYGPRQRGCHGPDRFSHRHGVFVGSFEFQGEGGFTAAHADRVKGTVSTPDALHCAHSGEAHRSHPGAGPKRTSFEAGSRSGLVAHYLYASRRGDDPATFVATAYESKGRLGIFRKVLARGPAASFASDSALSFATLEPPPPFSGSGYLRREASGAKTWSGSLAVSFPGAPDVPLAGPAFRTWLARSW